MKTKLLAVLMVMGTIAAPALANPSAQAAGEKPPALRCANTADEPYTGTYSRVTVPKGASCYLEDSLVTGNLKALRGAGDVLVINTEVQRNIHIRGAEGDVKIGPEDCSFDPPVGNNIHVTRSHNVAICWMTVDNNIHVTRNDGRIMLRDNVVGNNIHVTNNLPYVAMPGDGEHRDIAAIRLRDNVAEGHIDVRRNNDRPLKLKNNVPEPRT